MTKANKLPQICKFKRAEARKNEFDLRHIARSSHKITFNRTNFNNTILGKQPHLLSLPVLHRSISGDTP
jgi:hypothetical protein